MGQVVFRLAAMLLIGVLLGCDSAKYEDVRALPRYAALMDGEFRTRRALQLIGISTDRNYKPVVEYRLLVGTPGIAGPEVVERLPLLAGSRVKVVEITRCTNCLVAPVRIQIRIGPGDTVGDTPLFLDDRGNLLMGGGDYEPLTLNPDLFERIETQQYP